MNKIISLEEVSSIFRNGMPIMAGGFMGVTPQELVAALLEANVKDITLIANDTAFADAGIGPLIVNKRVKKVIASHTI